MAANQPHENATHPLSSYPVAEAEYADILQNSALFMEKFQIFHRSIGSKLKIPTIGGSALDLHRLFVEVTSRGGSDKVIKDRKWKEISMVFKFPSTITSASTVLRKYYESLLYHFEQVYYLRKISPPILATDAVRTVVNGSSAQNVLEDSSTTPQFSGSINLEPGSTVHGTIDAKFESGYLVSVNLGSEQLNGVLYLPTESDMSSNSNNSVTPRHRSLNRFGNPPRIEGNSSGYSYFYAEWANKLKPIYQDYEKDMSTKIGLMWNRFSEDEKKEYQRKELEDHQSKAPENGTGMDVRPSDK